MHADSKLPKADRGAEAMARDAERKARLAAALRDNLRKRKVQSRARKATDDAAE